MKILSPFQDFDFHTHEVDGKITPVDFRKSYRILLCGDYEICLPSFAAIDNIQNFLLREAVMIHKPLGVNEIPTQFDRAFLETDRQGNTT